MEIQFSQKAAEDACAELGENAAGIDKKRSFIELKNTEMGYYWQGELAEHILSAVADNMRNLESLKSYVGYLNNRIYVCRTNYKLSEEANSDIQKDIDSLFM